MQGPQPVLARDTLAQSGQLQDTLKRLGEESVRRDSAFFILPEGTMSRTKRHMHKAGLAK